MKCPLDSLFLWQRDELIYWFQVNISEHAFELTWKKMDDQR